ncbi:MULTISPECIES: SRPBCC family protein [Flavobacteriaceae]|jgi:ligand-binding SRPBCC domain-containing protein|uniref:SRPBCC family protein n=1 Tax=Flavobacteriaceae TaxID=49546 RepID=UPI002074E1B7|nr:MULTISPECIES: SRPBCC family protein [Allomuricauda]USD24882.1 SRPBCC family protein [Allomuricauda aquimarina]
MQLYQLKSRQFLPISKKEAWDFLSDPKNLAVITPPHMGFHILSGADRPMFQGQIIQYIVKPFPLVSTKWVTEITHVQKGSYFVDEQRFGPYSLWHHKHFIKEVPDGVEMEDIIDYKLPFGFLGQIMHPILVKKQLQKIFRFREKKLAEMFGEVKGKTNYLNLRKV